MPLIYCILNLPVFTQVTTFLKVKITLQVLKYNMFSIKTNSKGTSHALSKLPKNNLQISKHILKIG